MFSERFRWFDWVLLLIPVPLSLIWTIGLVRKFVLPAGFLGGGVDDAFIGIDLTISEFGDLHHLTILGVGIVALVHIFPPLPALRIASRLVLLSVNAPLFLVAVLAILNAVIGRQI